MENLPTTIVVERALGLREAKTISAAISALIAHGQVKLVLDWRETLAIDPLAIGLLLNSQHALLENGGELKFCRMGPAVKKIFFDFGVAEFFDSYATLENAIESFDEEWNRESGGERRAM